MKTILLPVVLLMSVAVNAQSSEDKTINKCNQASYELAKLQEQGLINSSKADNYYRIWNSDNCKKKRNDSYVNTIYQFNEIEKALEKSGIDYKKNLPTERSNCIRESQLQWQKGDAKFKSTNKPQELFSTCILNKRYTLFSEALNELNSQERNRFLKEKEAFDIKNNKHLAALEEYKIEQDMINQKNKDAQIAYEKSIKIWKEQVRRCLDGDLKYCLKE